MFVRHSPAPSGAPAYKAFSFAVVSSNTPQTFEPVQGRDQRLFTTPEQRPCLTILSRQVFFQFFFCSAVAMLLALSEIWIKALFVQIVSDDCVQCSSVQASQIAV